eukprot:CAMPEP_0117030582 /NCGR_PEP_ID=MMETSP0472-20121206/22063_1 /TAXON_ID=693140 ORGANISM="Tiarina fusus, Strain LIS" /NCGR_SAMPLE_ID=MMETSP0472 /ASSEMBLY_ACC=CAM_ASM_000603 /LENGTH=262 /DNA_ID=CAMNT_0004738697 /DNA_START=23 /DNA_END=811 /DNA_ORIENTATION=-
MTTQLVRYKQGKNNFEIMVKPGTVKKYKNGELDINSVIETDVIFKNQSKGDRANTTDLANVFETEDNMACIKIILEKGDVQLSAAERKAILDKKRSEIVNYVHKYYVDPKTKLPHPTLRIERAIEELKFRISPDQPGERQAQELVKKLPDVLPIKKCEIVGYLKVPHKHMGSVGGVIAQFVTVVNEKWDGDGCRMEVSLVPGDYDKFLAELNKYTKGEFQFDVEGAPGAGEPAAPPAKGKKKGKTKIVNIIFAVEIVLAGNV